MQVRRPPLFVLVFLVVAGLMLAAPASVQAQAPVQKLPPGFYWDFNFQQVANGPTDQQIQNGAAKILVAVVAHKVAVEVKNAPGAGVLEAIAEGIAKGVRDAAIKSGIQDLFPRLTPRTSADIQLLISAAADGTLNIRNLSAQGAKDRLIAALRASDPNLGEAAQVADLIYLVYQLSQQKR